MMPRPLVLLLFLLFAAPASLFFSLASGSVSLAPGEVFDAVVRGTPGVAYDVVIQLRAPRAAAAFACGSLLALSGTLFQVLLRNPLADPYILGVSGGAAVGALGATVLGLSAGAQGIGALAGALAAVALVFGVGFRSGDWNLYRLLLTGVVLSAGFTAAITYVLAVAAPAQTKGMLFWLMGDLAHAEQWEAAWLVLVAVSAASILLSNSLNVLSLGALKAKALGVALTPLQLFVYFCASGATVAAVVVGGTIGFVGLMVPHAIRLLGIADHRWLLPAALLLGGSFLTAADTLARSLWAPQQLPVGVLTALIGVPTVLFLLGARRTSL
jgi:iron complex transport system permease protein